MRPKLHADTFYMPVADGIYLRNNRSDLTIKGKTVYRWLENLVPYLDGRHELEELLQGLDASRKNMVVELVETLCNNHFLSDTSLDQPHTLSEEELARYASEIAFVGSFQTSAAWRFEMFRRLHLLVIGSGMAFLACIRSCLHSGIERLAIMKTAEEATAGDPSFAVDETILAQFRDPSQQIQALPFPGWDDRTALLHTIQPFDAVLHTADRVRLPHARLLNELCVEQQKILLQACFVYNRGWVGPLVRPGQDGCWECAWRRLQSNIQETSSLPLSAFEEQKAIEPGRWFAFPAAAIAANALVFELFKWVTQAGPQESAGQVLSLDLQTLSCQSHSFLPHPHCQSCQHPPVPTEAAFLAQFQQLERQEPLSKELFSARAARCFNEQFGIFRSIEEGNFEQVPLAVCKVEIANPPAFQDRLSGEQRIIAAGINFQDARQRATRRACEIYASRTVDPRRLVSQIAASAPVVSPESLLTTTQASDAALWSWAFHLQAERACLVPASLVFSSFQSEAVGNVERGIGSGMSWPEAVCRALLDWACYLTTVQLNEEQQPYARVDLRSVPWTPEGEQIFSLLTAVEAMPEVYDVTGSLGVPTFAICTGEQTIGCISHYDPLQALCSGLELALQRFQSHLARQLEYDVDPSLSLAPSLRSDRYTGMREVSLPQQWSACQLWLQQQFRKSGWHALAVPLNHDPALANVLPFIVRVLLARIESKREYL